MPAATIICPLRILLSIAGMPNELPQEEPPKGEIAPPPPPLDHPGWEEGSEWAVQKVVAHRVTSRGVLWQVKWVDSLTNPLMAWPLTWEPTSSFDPKSRFIEDYVEEDLGGVDPRLYFEAGDIPTGPLTLNDISQAWLRGAISAHLAVRSQVVSKLIFAASSSRRDLQGCGPLEVQDRLRRGNKRVMESDMKGFKKEMITKTVACTASTWDGICHLENPNEGYRPQITLTTLETFYTMFGEVILTPPKIKNATDQSFRLLCPIALVTQRGVRGVPLESHVAIIREKPKAYLVVDVHGCIFWLTKRVLSITQPIYVKITRAVAPDMEVRSALFRVSSITAKKIRVHLSDFQRPSKLPSTLEGWLQAPMLSSRLLQPGLA